MRTKEPGNDDDGTVIVRIPRTSRIRRHEFKIVSVFLLAGVTLSLIGWWIAASVVGPALRATPTTLTAPTIIGIVSASEAEIAAHSADRLAIFRLANNSRILILDYPTLRQQGLAMNRIAAFVEKLAQPRDHVLEDGMLSFAVTHSGETTESYYYGHDYGARDLVRFFVTAQVG
jgi:hypothetical protein